MMPSTPYVPAANFMDLLLDAVCVVDAEGRFVFASAACERIFGYTPGEMVGRLMIDMVAPEDRERTLAAAGAVMAGHLQTHFENRYVRKDGSVVHVMWSARQSGADQLRIAVARDITERKRAESMQDALYAISEAAHAAEDLAALFERIHQVIGDLLTAANFSVALYDADSDVLSFPYHVDERAPAPAPGRLAAGTLHAEVIRNGRALLLTPEMASALDQPAMAPAGDDTICWLGVPLDSPRGTIGALVVQSYGGSVRYDDKDRELLQFVSAQVAAAIERKRSHVRLQHSARYDQLTRLANRGLLHERLQAALSRAQHEGGRLSLLYVDLDDFKRVNDGLGHATGDLLLQGVAERLRHCVRSSDTVARVGGDEFVVLLEGIPTAQAAIAVAEKIRDALGRPFTLAGNELLIGPSIGIALYPQHGEDAQQLLHHADMAMYVAKQNGGNQCRVAVPGLAAGHDVRA